MSNNVNGLKRRVLMIDDDLTIIKSIQVLLELEGIEMDYYSSPNDFINNVENIEFPSYDILICDYKMPDMNGVVIFEELLRLNKQLPKYKVLYTGNKGQLSMYEFLQMEENDIKIYMKGSVDLDLLFEKIYNF